MVFLLGLLAGQANADVFFVSKTASGANNGTSWINAFTTIASAISASTAGDEIWVAATGTYNENIVLKADVFMYGGFQGDETLRGDRDWSTYQTIVDGGGSGHVVEGAEGAILDGFTIQNGNASGSFPDGYGGGIQTYQISMDIANCVIRNNNAVGGGGVFCYGGTPTIRNCTINGNTANSSSFGGIYGYDSNCVISDCTVSNNTNVAVRLNSYAILKNSLIDGNPNGGISCAGNAQILDCTITNNTGATNGGGIDASDGYISGCTIDTNSASSRGGGVSITGTVTLVDTWFGGNTGYMGGAVNCTGASPTISRCVFVGNTASYAGGGVYADNFTGTVSQCSFYNNTGQDPTDKGGAMVVWNSPPTVTSSIMWGNNPNEITGSANVSYSIVQGGYTGTGNLVEDPLWVSAGTDFHLQSGSPAIDTGDPGILTDPDNTRADMGAFYYPQATAPAILLSPSSFSPTAVEGQNAPDNVFLVSNSGGGILRYSLSDDSDWLSVSPVSGNSTGESDPTTITYNTTGLTSGSYNTTITVSDRFASNDPQKISISLTVTPPTPEIDVNPTSLEPVSMEGIDAMSDTFTVRNSGLETTIVPQVELAR